MQISHCTVVTLQPPLFTVIQPMFVDPVLEPGA